MADVRGPGGLPGQKSSPPEGMQCDDCSDPATVRVQGETDSFGSEQHDLCAACAKKMLDEEADTSGRCDYCKQEAQERVWIRDYDEGMGGPVYHVCRACQQRQQDRINEEAAYQDDYYDYDEPEDDCCPNCGGDGVVYSCFDECACVDPESGCDECERVCDWCKPRPASAKAEA